MKTKDGDQTTDTSTAEGSNPSTGGMKVSKWQFLVVCFVLMNEAIATTMLFPFVGLFIAHLDGSGGSSGSNGSSLNTTTISNGSSTTHTTLNTTVIVTNDTTYSPDLATTTAPHGDSRSSSGYYSGLLIGCFQLMQFFAAPRWGHLGDHIGRRPIMTFGLVAASIVVLLFGLSTSVWMAMGVRLVHGCISAGTSIAKTYVAEISNKENQARGFGLMSAAWSVGALFGPAIGGMLYDPAHNKYLTWMGLSRDGFWAEFPAFMPCLASACYGVFSCVLCVTSLKESNPKAVPFGVYLNEVMSRRGMQSKRHANDDDGNIVESGDDLDEVDAVELIDVDSETGEPSSPDLTKKPSKKAAAQSPTSVELKKRFTFMDLFRHPVLSICVPMYMSLCAFNIIFNEGFPLYAIAYIKDEGLELASEQVGLVFMMNAVVAVVANAYFGQVTKIMPLLELWRTCMLFSGFVLLCCGTLTTVRQNYSIYVLFATMGIISLVRTTFSTWSFSLCMMFVANSAPKEQLGAVTGLSHACGAISRCVFPILAAPMFAWSISAPHYFPFNHFLIFVVCAILALMAFMMSLYLEEQDVAPRDGAATEEGTEKEEPEGKEEFEDREVNESAVLVGDAAASEEDEDHELL